MCLASHGHGAVVFAAQWDARPIPREGNFSILAEAEGPEPTEKRQHAAAVFWRPTAGWHPLAVLVKQSHSKLCRDIALVCCKTNPAQPLGGVLLHPLTIDIHQPELKLRN